MQLALASRPYYCLYFSQDDELILFGCICVRDPNSVFKHVLMTVAESPPPHACKCIIDISQLVWG